MTKKRKATIVGPDGETPARAMVGGSATELTPVDTLPAGLEPTGVALFERLAKDPSVDVEKFARLIDMQERIMRIQAKAAFEVAFAAMQPDIPAIKKRGVIPHKGGQGVKARYAKYEDIIAKVKPILKEHGFTLRHKTEWPGGGIIRVVGFLTHVAGHCETSTFEAPPDKNEYRSAIQDVGSTESYGKRYTTKDLLLIAEEGEDTDGVVAPRTERQPPSQPSPVASHPQQHAVISEGQRKRLYAIVKTSGRTKAEVSVWLQARFRWSSSEQIARDQYDYVCKCIEHPGALPLEGA